MKAPTRYEVLALAGLLAIGVGGIIALSRPGRASPAEIIFVVVGAVALAVLTAQLIAIYRQRR